MNNSNNKHMNTFISPTVKIALFPLLFLCFMTCKENPVENILDTKIPPQSQDSMKVFSGYINRYTNKDSIQIKGYIRNYNIICCEGGRESVRQLLSDSSYSIWIKLNLNVLNTLILFAEDHYGRHSDTVTIRVIHDNMPPKLLESSVTQGEISVSVNTPLQFKFDSPLSFFWADYILENLRPSFTYSFTDNAKCVTISRTYIYVGVEYPLQIVAQDSANNSLDTTITFRTYFNKINVTGNSYYGKPFLSMDGSILFVPQYSPTSILLIDVSTWSIIKTIQTDYSIQAAAYNPYNGNIYYTSNDSKNIIEINPMTGAVVNSILPLKTGNDFYPPDHAVSLAFTSSGIGIVSAKYLNTSGPYSIQIIDSRHQDSIYVHSTFAPEVYNAYSVFSFNNYNNIVLVDLGGGSSVQIYNPITNSFKSLSIAEMHSWVVGHSLKDRFVIYGSDGWWLFNSSGTMIGHSGYSSSTSYFDFTYLPNEDNWLYYVDFFSNLGLYDIANENKVIETLLLSNNTDAVLTTFDGKYIIVSQVESLLIVEPKSFR